MPELLSDETWQRLDPSAGRPTRRDLRWVLLGAAVFATAMVVVLSGLVMPRLVPAGGAGYGYGGESGAWVMDYQFDIRNDGWFPVEIVDVGRNGPGLDLVGTLGVGNRIGAGRSANVGVSYDVTDCAAVPAEAWPVPVRVARPWGSHTVWMELEPQFPEDFDLPLSDASTDELSSWEATVEWQRNLADAICYDRDGVLPGER